MLYLLLLLVFLLLLMSSSPSFLTAASATITRTTIEFPILCPEAPPRITTFTTADPSSQPVNLSTINNRVLTLPPLLGTA